MCQCTHINMLMKTFRKPYFHIIVHKHPWWNVFKILIEKSVNWISYNHSPVDWKYAYFSLVEFVHELLSAPTVFQSFWTEIKISMIIWGALRSFRHWVKNFCSGPKNITRKYKFSNIKLCRNFSTTRGQMVFHYWDISVKFFQFESFRSESFKILSTLQPFFHNFDVI